MIKGSKQRNIITTVFLWLTILVNLAMTVGFIVSMYVANAMEETLGLGLCSMFTFANVLGAILLMRWNKYGLGLTVVSVSLLSIVYAYVLNLGLIPTIPFFVAIFLLWLILQIKKSGKSAWSQLNSGWDSKYCRHIYQVFAVIELILFILTLIAFGNHKGNLRNPDPILISHDTIVIERQNLHKKNSTDPNTVTDSVKTETTNHKKTEKDIPERKKTVEHNIQKDKSPQKVYSLKDAAEYLDSHDEWRASEMAQYPQIYDLNYQIIRSMREGRFMIFISCPSKKLNKIRSLMKEIDRLAAGSDRKIVRKYLKSSSNQSQLNPNEVIQSLRRALDYIKMYDKQRKVRDKNIGTGGEESPDEKSVRKKRIQKEIDDYKKLISDSIKDVTPTFGLR